MKCKSHVGKKVVFVANIVWILYVRHNQILTGKELQQDEEGKADGQSRALALEDFNNSLQTLCKRYDYEVQWIKPALEVDVFENMYKQPQPPNDTLSLITHLTMSRFGMLKKMAANWEGPISATIYLNIAEYQLVKEELKSWLNMTLRTNIIFHFVFQKGVFYPVNRLRNVGLENCGASFVIMVDVDFLPSKQLYKTLLSFIEKGFFNTTEKRAAVVPAFEMVNESSVIPQSREEVRTLYTTRKLLPFHYLQYPPRHLPTKSEKWMTANDLYKVTYKKEYEPYVLLKRADCPAYDEHLLQRFSNKAVHIHELQEKGFTFWVIPKVFLVHIPHPSLHMKTLNVRSCVRKYIPAKMRMRLQS